MKKKITALLACAAIVLNICGCGSKDLQTESFNETNTQTEATKLAKSNSNFNDPQSAIVKVGSTILVGNDGDGYGYIPDKVEYTVKSMTLYEDISSFKIPDNFESKKFIEQGKLKSGYKFVLLDLEANCIEVSNTGDIENEHNLSCFHLNLDEQYYLSKEYEICEEIPYIEMEESAGIKHFKDDKKFYTYTLPKGSSASIQIGFFVPTALIEKKEAFISIDTRNLEDESKRFKFMVIE